MARVPSATADPAGDAAVLLRRLGFAILMLVLPLATVFVGGAVILLAPLAVIVLVLAAVLDGSARTIRMGAGRALLSPAGLAGGLVLGWCVLSLIWTPFPGPAAERLLGLIGILAMGLVGYVVLPERVRAANLYILPVGLGVTAVVAAALGLLQDRDSVREAGNSDLERGLVVLVLLVWPALGWLRSRERELEALLLAVAVTLAVLLAPYAAPPWALVIGALVFVLTAAKPRAGVEVTAWTMAALLLLAPLLPFLLGPLLAGVFGAADPTAQSLEIWRAAVAGEPARLVTGRGFEMALHGRTGGLLPEGAPTTPLFEIWYELGIIGAAAGAAALLAAARAGGRSHAPLVPGVMASFASAFVFACLGLGVAQAWPLTVFVVTTLIFVATQRGQFRTTRPKAILRGRA